MTQQQSKLLDLLSLVLFENPLPVEIQESEWSDLYQLAKDHAVLPLVYIGLTAFRYTLPDEMLQQWRKITIMTVLHNEKMLNIQDRVLTAMEEANIRCAILKGCSHSVYYGNPDMRPLGDIDILINLSDIEKAKSILIEQGFRAPETDHPFHIDLYGHGAVVELHYTVSTFPDSPGGHAAEKIMSGCLDEVKSTALNNHKFPTLSTTHQALNQLLHMERHMTTQSVGLRQLCDWAAFLSNTPSDTFLQEILPSLQSCGMDKFAKVLTKVCVRYLKANASDYAWCMDVDDSLVAAMIEEFLRAGNMNVAAAKDDLSSVLVDRNGNSVKAFIRTLNHKTKTNYPITGKCPILLPVFWPCYLISYWIKMHSRGGSKKAIQKTLSSAKSRNDLYRELHLFGD